MADTNVLPPPPYREPMLTRDGTPTEPWANWFRQIFTRGGGSIALTNAQLETIQQQDLTEVVADITTLESQMTAVQNTNTTQNTNITTLQGHVEGLRLAPVAE